MNNVDEALLVTGDDLLTVAEATAALGISEGYLRRLRRERKIGCVRRQDRRIFFTSQHICDYQTYRAALLAAHEVPARLPGQLEFDLGLAASTPQSPAGTQLAA